MIYPDDLEQRIGFDKVRESIAAYCQSSSAREHAMQVAFMTDSAAIVRALGLGYEMRTIKVVESDFPTIAHVDFARGLAKIRIEGSYLPLPEVVELRRAIELTDTLVRFFRTRSEENNPYPLLTELSAPIATFTPLGRAIDRVVDSSLAVVRDNATPELGRVRQELARKSVQVEKRLHSILRAAQAAGLVDTDTEISIRDGRAVIPVAAANKRKIKGLVHDESATGRTAYIEPIEVVELGNEIRELESAERREVIRILMALADTLRPELDELLAAGEYLTHLDYLNATARYALDTDSTRPQLTSDATIELTAARHPLLEKTLRKEGRAIVPLDMRLTQNKYILLISGPNAGGKSVCLKTVGLLQYMVQCGLLIPASDRSQVGVFESIFIDIGDQQSLDNDLSTYSSHLQNMKTVLRSANSRSLVLIDEFGSGTEPNTGGAIAEAVLEKLVEREVRAVITTHYANLKYYAAGATGIENGAMTFDLQQIRPLFRLEMGHPGSSFAFEIARKIGLPEEIISSATEKIGTTQTNVERHIRQATRDKRYWENKREAIRHAEKQIDRTAAQYESQLAEIQLERTRLLKEARAEAANLIAEANRRIENTIREIRESQADRERTRTARTALGELRDELSPESSTPIDPNEDPIERKMRQLREREQRRLSRKQNATAHSKPEEAPREPVTRPLEVGFHVRLKGQTAVGQVESISGRRATVAFDHISSTIDTDRLEIVPHKEFRKIQRASYTPPPAESYDSSKKRLNFSTRLDLRGLRAHEALDTVQSYIDEAIVLGISKVTILHGKGTGALKQEVRRYLDTVPEVASAEDEHVEFGGAGITVVTLSL